MYKRKKEPMSTAVLLPTKYNDRHNVCFNCKSINITYICIIVTFIFFLIISTIIIFILGSIATKNQHNTYRKYSPEPNNCIQIDIICNSKCDELVRRIENENGELRYYLDPGTDFNALYILNILIISGFIVGFIGCIILMIVFINAHQLVG